MYFKKHFYAASLLEYNWTIVRPTSVSRLWEGFKICHERSFLLLNLLDIIRKAPTVNPEM